MKRCARCGKRLPAGQLHVYSRWTKSYYCLDVTVCARRAKRADAQKGTGRPRRLHA